MRMKLDLQTDNITLMTLIGAGLGVAAYWSIKFSPSLSLFFILFNIAFMMTFLHEQKDVWKTAIYATAFAGFVALCGFLNYHFFQDVVLASANIKMHSALPTLFYMAIAFIISSAFFMAYETKGYWNADYQLLDLYAWNRPLIYIGASLYVVVLWVILIIWMGLFGVIGIDAFKKIFTQPWFIYALAGGGFALGAAMLVKQERLVSASRDKVQGLCTILVPLVTVLVVSFLAMLPLSGLQPIWDTGYGSVLVIILIVVIISLMNSVVRSDEVAGSKLYGTCAKLMALSLPVFAFIAIGSIAIRIHAYGLTPKRIDAAILLSIGALYASTYAVTVIGHWNRNWVGELRRVNVINALIVLTICLLMITPLVKRTAISAWHQKHMLLSGKIAPEDFDFASLRFLMAKDGLNALEDIRQASLTHPNGKAIMDQMVEVDKMTSYRRKPNKQARQRTENKNKPIAFADGFEVYPSDATVPPGFEAYIADRENFKSTPTCHFVPGCIRPMGYQPAKKEKCQMVRGDQMGYSPDEWFITGSDTIAFMCMARYANGQWTYMKDRFLSHDSVGQRGNSTGKQLRDAIRQGRFKFERKEVTIFDADGLKIVPTRDLAP